MHPRWNGQPTGRLVTAQQDGQQFTAYVPNPLPPELLFDRTLIAALSRADRMLGELAGLGRTMPNPALLVGPFVRREAVLSSRIEGTQTNIADLYAFEAGQALLPGLAPSVPSSDTQEVMNYVTTLRYGLERLSTLPLSLRLILELHERLMTGVRGQEATPGAFRTIQNWIGRPNAPISAAEFVPPPVSELSACLHALEQYLHADDHLPPLIRIGLIHYQFEAIHPFRDGNGRIGRLLISLLFHEWQLLPAPLLYLSAYFERRRTAYFDHLLAVSLQGAWDNWLVFFLNGVAEQAHDAIKRAKRLQELQQEWRSRLSLGQSSVHPLRLIDTLFETPILTIPAAEKLLDVTYHTAQRHVNKLIDAGILRPVDQSSYDRRFVAADILRVVTEPVA